MCHRAQRWALSACDDRGFTLAEVAFVVLVIGILLTIAVASYIPAAGAANAATCIHNRRVLQDAAAIMMCTPGEANLTDLQQLRPYVTNFDTVSCCPSDDTAFVLDPESGEVACPNHE